MAKVNRRPNVNARASSAITAVVAGTVVGGNSCNTENLLPGGGLFAEIAMGVKTTSLTMTPSWQYSQDNAVTWKDIKAINNAANVATAAGTGTLVTTTVTVHLPDAATFPLVRAIITTAGATAHATDDVLAIKYHYVAR